jgi:hypothetical protein
MKLLNHKWFSFFCMCVNFYFTGQSLLTGDWLLTIICGFFTGLCGYNFWKQMGEE